MTVERWLIHASLLIVVACTLLTISQQESTSKDHHQTANQFPAPIIESVAQPNPTPQQNGSQKESDDPLCIRLWNALISNWPLVAIGIPGIWLTVRTLRAIEKQADAMINSERAWIVAELVPMCAQFGNLWHRRAGSGWATMSAEETFRGDHLKHKMRFTNMGRTPAHILSFKIDYSCLLGSVAQADLPEGASGDPIIFAPFDHLLAAGEFEEVLGTLIDVHRYINGSNSIEVNRAIRESKRAAVMVGTTFGGLTVPNAVIEVPSRLHWPTPVVPGLKTEMLTGIVASGSCPP